MKTDQSFLDSIWIWRSEAEMISRFLLASRFSISAMLNEHAMQIRNTDKRCNDPDPTLG